MKPKLTHEELTVIRKDAVEHFLRKADNYVHGAGAARVPFDNKTGHLVIGWLKTFNNKEF